MSSPVNISDLNKKAVYFVRAGNYQAAVFALDSALKHLHNTCLARVNEEPQQQCIGGSSLPQEVPIGMDLDEDDENDEECRIRSVPISPSVKSPSSSDNAAENLFEFYARMLVLEDNQSDSNTYAEQVVLLYNTGVANHKEGLRRGGKQRTFFFERALDLYNMAQEVLYDAWADIANDEVQLLLSLALSNNVGHVHYYLHNFEESRYSLQALQHFMASLPECYDDDDEGEVPGSLCPEDYKFFNTTTVIFEGAHFTVAPSA